MINNTLEDCEFYQFVYDTFTCGIICGLQHPIEWAINIHRTPGVSFKPEFYQSVEKHLPRFLCLLYELFNMDPPRTAKNVLQMCDQHYQHNTFCQGYFDFLEPQIDQYILKGENNGNRR
jgi:hypothetical protein